MRSLLPVLQVVGVLWALPVSLLGLCAGTCALAFGARVRLERREFALVFHRFPWGRGGALTLGNVILHTGQSMDVRCSTYAHAAGLCVEPGIRLGDHERAHVFQTMVLGSLFLPLYFLCGGISVRNPFERAADRYALSGRGWWPFRNS